MHINSNNVSQICCQKDTEVTFYVRNDAYACLNGEKILCSHNADNLPFGMRSLYKQSEKLMLKSGTNIIRTSEDFKYLPSLLVSGDFTCQNFSGDVCKIDLSPRKVDYLCGDKIYGYDVVEFTTEIYIPSDVEKLQIYGTDVVTRVCINGTPVGIGAFAPYEFKIPSEAKDKKAELKIVQYSSIAPIFGDVDFWDKTVECCGWRGTPSPENRYFGFSKIMFKRASK